MSEISIGDITSRLRLDATDWQRELQQAMQSLAQFRQAKDTIITNLQRFQQALSQATAQGTQQMQTLTAQTQHTSQTFQQFNQQINQDESDLPACKSDVRSVGQYG